MPGVNEKKTCTETLLDIGLFKNKDKYLELVKQEISKLANKPSKEKRTLQLQALKAAQAFLMSQNSENLSRLMESKDNYERCLRTMHRPLILSGTLSLINKIIKNAPDELVADNIVPEKW